MAGYINEANPYDFGGAIQRGLQGGRLRRAKSEAKGYLDAGDYEGAAKAVLPYDMEEAQGYLSYGNQAEQYSDRRKDKQYSRDLAPYVAKDDWDGASEFALKNDRGADEIVSLRKMAKQAQTDKLESARQNSEDFAGALNALGQLPDDQYMPAYQATLQEYGAKGADVTQYQNAQTPAQARAAARAALMRNLKAKEIFDYELDSRKTDVQERRADAAELTANAAWAKANSNDGPAAPKGYRYTPEGDLEPIPGGKEWKKDQATKRKADLLIGGVEASSGNVLGAIDKARKLSQGWLNTGMGSSVTGRIGGSDAHNLQRQLATIKANLGFDKLAEMRASSPTGGALGAVTERELDLLQSVVANLDQSQSDEQLRENLDLVEKHYRNTLARMKAAYAEDYGDQESASAGAPPLSGRKPQGDAQRLTPEQAAALPPGTPFIGMDGKQRVRK